jgi:hypothetical protein
VEADFKGDESKLAKQGVLQPSDSIWEHLRFEQLDSSKDKKEKCLFIHTSVQIWSDSVEGRRRVLQLMTAAPESPLLAKCYIPNPAFEQQAITAWKMAQAGAAGQPFTAPEDETVITFNPKELILLEKAFDNLLTATDLKSDAVKYSELDAIKCQRIIKRAKDEFVNIGPPKKRRKKTDKPKVDGVVTVKDKVDAKTKAAPKSKATPKSPAKKPASAKKSKPAKTEEAKKPEEKIKEENKSEEDSDDEPIRKLKEAEPKKATKVADKAAEKSPTRSSRRSSKSSTPKAKTPKAKTPKTEEDSSKKKGRPRGSKASSSKPKKEEASSKKRKSKSKK